MVYRDTRGRTHDAVITSAGAGANEVNLRVPHLTGSARIKANVAKATTEKQTDRWFWRTAGPTTV